MRTDTRLAYNAFLTQVAHLNGVPSAIEQFDVQPTIQQKLEQAMQESSAYLRQINVVGVVEQSGAKLKLGVSGPIASRTDTTNKERSPRDVSKLGERGYVCEKTNSDTAIGYGKLDAWAKFPNFQTMLRDAIVQRQALDRLMIGWTGTHVAPDSDLAAFPLLQDLNKGWLQHLREDAPERVMHEVVPASGKVRVGPGGDYANLDALVYDAITLLDPWYQEDGGLRAHVGRALMHDKYFPVINRDQRATDELASQLLVSQKAIGGLPGLVAPSFPPNALLITRPDNLSIYYQEGARRRALIDEPKRDRIANYESSNDAYVVEDNGLAVLIENIQLGDWTGTHA